MAGRTMSAAGDDVNSAGSAGTAGSSASGQGGAGAVASGVVDQVQEVTDQVQEQAGRLVDQARQQLTTQVATQKDRAAGGLETAAGLLRGAGEQLRALDQPAIAQYVDSAAERAQEFSEQLRTQDVGQLVEATERFARRQPALFAGSALALGYLASRFFLSSERRQDTSSGQQGDQTRYQGTASSPSYGADIYATSYAETMPVGTLDYGAGSGMDAASTFDEPMADAYLDDPVLGGSDVGAPRTAGDIPPGSEER